MTYKRADCLGCGDERALDNIAIVKKEIRGEIVEIAECRSCGQSHGIFARRRRPPVEVPIE